MQHSKVTYINSMDMIAEESIATRRFDTILSGILVHNADDMVYHRSPHRYIGIRRGCSCSRNCTHLPSIYADKLCASSNTYVLYNGQRMSSHYSDYVRRTFRDLTPGFAAILNTICDIYDLAGRDYSVFSYLCPFCLYKDYKYIFDTCGNIANSWVIKQNINMISILRTLGISYTTLYILLTPPLPLTLPLTLPLSLPPMKSLTSLYMLPIIPVYLVREYVNNIKEKRDNTRIILYSIFNQDVLQCILIYLLGDIDRCIC